MRSKNMHGTLEVLRAGSQYNGVLGGGVTTASPSDYYSTLRPMRK